MGEKDRDKEKDMGDTEVCNIISLSSSPAVVTPSSSSTEAPPPFSTWKTWHAGIWFGKKRSVFFVLALLAMPFKGQDPAWVAFCVPIFKPGVMLAGFE